MTRLAPILCAWLVLIGLTISTSAATPYYAPAATRPVLKTDAPLTLTGTGKVYDFGHATLIHDGHNRGVAPWLGGGLLRIVSTLGEPQAKRPKGGEGVWTNPRGTVGTLLGLPGQFDELAPLSHRASPAKEFAYREWRPFIVPADKITLRNLTVRVTNTQADGVLWLHYARRPTVESLRVEYGPGVTGTGPGHVALLGCGWATLRDVEAPSIGLNSSHDVTISGCRVSALVFEEAVTDVEVSGTTSAFTRINDKACRRLSFVNCALGDFYSIGGQRLSLVNCTWTRLVVADADSLRLVGGGGPKPELYRIGDISRE